MLLVIGDARSGWKTIVPVGRDSVSWCLANPYFTSILSSATFITPSGFAPENEYTTLTVRQLLHGPFRILYEVHDANVYVLTVRHGARRFMSGDELEQME